MPEASKKQTDRMFFGVAVGVVALVAALFPLGRSVDQQVDRTRPMYADRDTMEWLQFQSVATTGEAVALEVADGESVSIAGAEFTPAAGVTVVVRTPQARSYCVQVSNEHGDVSEWACLDEEEPPVNPGDEMDLGL